MRRPGLIRVHPTGQQFAPTPQRPAPPDWADPGRARRVPAWRRRGLAPVYAFAVALVVVGGAGPVIALLPGQDGSGEDTNAVPASAATDVTAESAEAPGQLVVRVLEGPANEATVTVSARDVDGRPARTLDNVDLDEPDADGRRMTEVLAGSYLQDVCITAPVGWIATPSVTLVEATGTTVPLTEDLLRREDEMRLCVHPSRSPGPDQLVEVLFTLSQEEI